MTYWLERDDIFVGELFTTHNAYDHFWQNEPRSQDDYDPEAFVEYAAGTIDYVAISDEWNDEIAARAKEVEEFEARRTEQRKAESEWTARRAAELTAAREQGRTEKLRESNALQRKLEEERRGHQDRVEELCGRVTALEAELAALKGPPTSEQPMLAT